MKVEITKAQLAAICDMADTISSMMGCGNPDFDDECRKQVQAVDRFLKKNGYTRLHK